MPISSMSVYDASVAGAGTAEELTVPLPVEIPAGPEDPAYSVNIHGIIFYSSAFPATAKYQKWALRRTSQATPAWKNEAQDPQVICSHHELMTTSGIQTTKERVYEKKIPYNVVQPNLYLTMVQDSGGAIEMGVRIEFTFKKMKAELWMWANHLTSS